MENGIQMNATTTRVNDWLRCYRRQPDVQFRLFCFPYAGGGATVYRLWGQQLPAAVEVQAVQLPGREDRFKETALTSMEQLLDALVPALLPFLDRPYAFFGHSMGSAIAYALSCRLSERGLPLPLQLWVSGRSAPHWPRTVSDLHALPDLQFLDQLQSRYGGIPSEVWQDKELRALVLPTMRADMTLLETYRQPSMPPLPCPIACFWGRHDPHLNLEGMAAWQQLTSGSFRTQLFDGDHFYLKQQPQLLLNAIQQQLATLVVLSGR